MIETIAGVRDSRRPYRERSYRVDPRHDDAIDLSPFTPGVSVRHVAVSGAGFRSRTRIALRGSVIPRYWGRTPVSWIHTAVRARQRRRREVIPDDERFLSCGS